MGYDISSASNDRIKWLARLRDRRHRDAEGMFVVEGDRLYGRALAAGHAPNVTFVSDEEHQCVGDVITVAPDVLDKASYRSHSEGIIGVFTRWDTSLGSLRPGAVPLLLVVEGIEKPGNLGAMVRTSAAAGVDAVITVDHAVDVFNPNAIRASTGAIFAVPVVSASWDELAPWLSDHSIPMVAASPEASVPMWEADLRGPLAIVVGAEDSGLSSRARALADKVVAIPQVGVDVDSLNASVAAAVLIFEVRRQRPE